MLKYSIIVPVYNCEAYLDACVKCILNQKGNHKYEIILVDDGSNDKSGSLVDDLSEHYIQVRAIHKENGGAASARNRGIQEATGEYLLFIDGDDTVEDTLLENVSCLLEKDSQAMILFGLAFDYYRSEKLERSMNLSCLHEGTYSVERLLEEYQSFFFDNALSSACNKVFLAQTVKKHKIQFQEGMTLYEDYDFVLRYLMHVESVICLNAPLYHYRNDLENVHLNSRVADLIKLQGNLSQLMQSILVLYDAGQHKYPQLLDVSANLYLQLLMQNLMIRKYTVAQLQNNLSRYCEEKTFRTLLEMGAKLQEKEARLLQQIDAGKYYDISWDIRKKRMIVHIKRIVKQVIKTIGL